RAGAAGPWPGAAVTPAATLPVVEAPLPSVHVALAHARRSRPGAPRFGRTGFPLDPKDRAARRDRLRARVVTTTVVATVVAAPVIALWAAYRGAPLTGEGHDGSSVTATEADEGAGPGGEPYGDYENAGNASPDGDTGFPGDLRRPDVSAEVVSAGDGRPDSRALTVSARSSRGLTAITLTASGARPVTWSATVRAPWLRLGRSSGTLAPGRSVTLYVRVDRAAEPEGPWSVRVLVTPSGSAVVITGYGRPVAPALGRPGPGPDPSSGPPGPSPSSPPPSSGPTPPTEPSEPTGPTPSATDPPATEPPGSPAPTPSPPEGTTPAPPPPGTGADPGDG
ncbi:hypothetical protein ABZ371_25680, partial [Streptomyces sp. NPDC005899]